MNTVGNFVDVLSRNLRALLGFVCVLGIRCMHRNVMKSGEMNHQMTLFHTMGPNRNVLFQTYHLFL